MSDDDMIQVEQEVVDAINKILRKLNELDICSEVVVLGTPTPGTPEIYIGAGEREKALFRKLYELLALDEDDLKEMVRHANN